MHYPTMLLRHSPLLILFALAPVVKAEKPVLARSTVSSDYLKNRRVDGKLQPQTYVFMTGRHFAGNRHDRSLEKTSFRTIAERLAQDLRSQEFYPAASLAKADLLLVVHWGVTAGRNRDSVAMSMSAENIAGMNIDTQEAQRTLDEAIAAGDFAKAGEARDNLASLANQTKSEYETIASSASSSNGEDSASLLGLTAALRGEDKSLFEYERRKTLFEMTQEECYFVIVVAYDAPTLLSTKKLKRVWTMRTSINSAGVNFHQALDRIGNVASLYFGIPQDNVAFEYPKDRKRTENVTLGEFIVLGPVTP